MATSKLYLIEDKTPVPPGSEPRPGRRRLIEAISESGAFKHVTGSMFAVRRVTKPVEVGELVRAGVEIEKAGEPFATRVNASTGMVEVKFASFLPFEPTGPATLAQLGDESAGTWEVHVESGMVRHQPTGEDGEGSWHDIREATPAEIAEAKGEPAPEPPAKRRRRPATK